MASIERIVIAGGGTGGHVYPGIAVAEEILRRNATASLLFIGSRHGLESKLVSRLGHRIELLDIRPLRFGNLRARHDALRLVPRAIHRSRRILARFRPQVVLGTGGFPAGPALVAAWSKRLPVALHEQNAIPGLANRLLRPFVQLALLGVEAAAVHFPNKPTLHTGNPLTPSLASTLSAVAEARTTPASGTLGIVVLGGSLGAVFLNRVLPEALATYQRRRPDLTLRVLHQAGEAHVRATRAAYARAGLVDEVRVTGFIHDRCAAYRAADLAISRAGAMTIADLHSAALPSLLVPLADAADNHQEANAYVAERKGSAVVQLESTWCADALTARLDDLTLREGRLAEMAACARAAAPTGAATAIVDALEALMVEARRR